MRIAYPLVYSFCYLLSLLPWRVLYRLSDVLSYFLYYCIRYRRNAVRKNLHLGFPEKKEAEIRMLEKKFYAFFCDSLLETVKLFSISEEEMKKRMVFEGIREMVRELEKENKLIGCIYLGYYGNWEWLSWLTPCLHAEDRDIVGGVIYPPLGNPVLDQVFQKLSSRFGGESRAGEEALQRMLSHTKSRRKSVIGFVSAPSAPWNGISHWANFKGHETPGFPAAEKDGEPADALIYYADVECLERGYYRCRIRRMDREVRQHAGLSLTDLYQQMLEETIRRKPECWLWTHPCRRRVRQNDEDRMPTPGQKPPRARTEAVSPALPEV